MKTKSYALTLFFLTVCVSLGLFFAYWNYVKNTLYRQNVSQFNQADNIFLRDHKKFAEVEPIYVKLAQNDFTEAQFRLATIYDDLSYTSSANERENYHEKSEYWYKKAAKNGHATAQNNLALQYGKHGDYQRKFKWLNKAAHQNSPAAQNNLGVMYHKGEYVAQDFEMAEFWYRKAILQDHAPAKTWYKNLMADKAAQITLPPTAK